MHPSASNVQNDDSRSDDSSTGSGSSDEGWGFLLGGLSTELMTAADWTITNDDENDTKQSDSAAMMRSDRPDANTNERTTFEIPDKNVQEKDQISLRAFCLSPNGQVLKPPVQILDRSCEQKGNILVATRNISKGQVIFTEKALEGIQVPSAPSATGTVATRNLYVVRACQMCFRSLEPASCLSKEGLPFSELWPVPEYEYEYEYDDPMTECHENSFIATEEESGGRDTGDSIPTTTAVAAASMCLDAKSGRVTCRDCGSMFCNRFCARNHLRAVGSCCRCARAIEGLVRTVVQNENENERLGRSPNDSDQTPDGEENQEASDDYVTDIDIDPVLVLAAKMFVSHVHLYRTKQANGDHSGNADASDSPFRGLCGEAEDIPSLGLGSISSSSPDDNGESMASSQPLGNEYEAIADGIQLTEGERGSDSLFSSKRFHKIAAIAQRNAISLTTGSPFRTYYQAMIRKTGGRGSSRQQQAVSEVARILGSKNGKLTRDMDRMVEEKCVVKMGGIFTLTARMNHSCDPNAEIRGQEYVDCNIDVVAKKDICRGEEICISYVNLGPNPSNSISTRNRRQRELRSRYLFHCQCSRCVR